MNPITMTIEREVVLSWDYVPAVKGSRDEQPSPEEFNITATLEGDEIELTDKEIESAEELILGHFQGERDAADEARAEAIAERWREEV